MRVMTILIAVLLCHLAGPAQEQKPFPPTAPPPADASFRARTSAEILMQRDHVTKWPAENPDQKNPMWWDHMMNDVFLPGHAKKYGCGLADVRGQWLEYLKANTLEPKALLKDDVHLNDQ